MLFNVHPFRLKISGLAICLFMARETYIVAPIVSISSGQQNLMKTYHNEANTGGITKIESKIFLEFFGQTR